MTGEGGARSAIVHRTIGAVASMRRVGAAVQILSCTVAARHESTAGDVVERKRCTTCSTRQDVAADIPQRPIRADDSRRFPVCRSTRRSTNWGIRDESSDPANRTGSASLRTTRLPVRDRRVLYGKAGTFADRRVDDQCRHTTIAPLLQPSHPEAPRSAATETPQPCLGERTVR